ncbi:restriction endonuclease subunit S [Streptococcus sp. HMSC067H01]|uniref:restriction endonuclease subunit S n=1 Tax=Streptococcus sp. HMSC067H01 TaxID=1739491 RepID=UPI0008D75328|nr:restriction endonuclease subunit S [Streptococcus sp. HMSC067H01]OFP42047.1 restriction endonuclease subunit S [Streptococcus sp. HMSC067H01]
MKKVKLGDLGKIITGNTPSKKTLEFYDSNDIPFIKPDDFKTIDEISLSKGNKNYISENARNSARIVPKNSVLVTCIGIIGKVMISESELSFNQQINAIVPNELILSKYLAYLLLYNKPKLDFISNAPVVPIINKTQFSEFEVTFHENIDVQEKIIQNLENLDNQILKRRHQSKLLSNLVKSRFNEMFGDPVLNEMGWDKHALKEFGIWKSGGTPKRNEEEFFRGNIPWITSGELEHKYIEDSFEKISEKAIECSSAKIIEKGSLLLGMYDTAGLKSSINTKVMSCNQAIAFAKLDDKITNTIYVYYVIQNLRSMLLNQQRGVRQKNFNLSMIKNISIPLPPLSLQNEFADFVAQVDKSQFACQMDIKLWRNSLKSSII